MPKQHFDSETHLEGGGVSFQFDLSYTYSIYTRIYMYISDTLAAAYGRGVRGAGVRGVQLMQFAVRK